MRNPRRSKLFGATLTGGVAVMLTSCGGGNVSGLDNAEDFLDEATEAWLESLPSDNMAIHDDAGCFLVVDADEEVTGELACGGARSLFAEDGEVWDTTTFDYSEDSDGDVLAEFDENILSAAQMEVPRPEANVVDADGNEAPSALDEVEAPSQPQADGGLVVTPTPDSQNGEGTDSVTGSLLGDEFSRGTYAGGEDSSPERSEIITPAGTITVEALGSAETVTVDGVPGQRGVPEDESAVPHAPADGETFTYLWTSFQENELPEAPENDAYLDLGDEQIDLSSLEGGGLVSVPDSGADLVVTTGEDIEQRYDLTTGVRESDPITDGFYIENRYQPEAGITLDFPDFEDTLTEDDVNSPSQAGDLTISTEATIDSYSINAWNPQMGWADEGEAWLEVNWEADVSRDGDAGAGYYRANDDQPSVVNWDITVDDQTIEESYESTDPGRNGGDSFGEVSVIAIPADFESISVSAEITSHWDEQAVTVEHEGTDLPFEESHDSEDSIDEDAPVDEDENTGW